MLELFQPEPHQVKILVVDDNPANIKVMRGFLAQDGYEIIAATSGESALSKIATEGPNLVLLDVMMPEMNGFEVCQRIKNTPATLFLPVILVTALEDLENRVKGIEVGADEFLSKPVVKQELLTRVKSLVRVKFLYDALEASNQQIRGLLAERTQELEQATQELQELLDEKARFNPNLIPSLPSVPVDSQAKPEPTHSIDEAGKQQILEFKRRLMEQLSETLKGRADLARTPEMANMLGKRLALVYEASDLRLLRLSDKDRQELFREIIDEVIGFGPIEPLLRDPTVSEAMVNGPSQIYVEREGRLTKTNVTFDDNDHVMRIIDRIVRPLGRKVDKDSPMVDARLPDGSRVNSIIFPCAIDGPSITIRKFSEDKLVVDDLVEFGTLTADVAEFLQACVVARLNIVVAGGTGSGKTTLLNVLSSFIQEDERIVTIEDSAELQLHQEHVVRLEIKPPDSDGQNEVSIRQLVRNALRMRPDRIVIGEVRGGEALDMLQAMNTGHDGSLTTIHANTPRDTLARLETLVLMAGMELPLGVIRSQVASAINLIVQQARLKDGSRKIINVTEVQGIEGDIIVLSDIFEYKERQTGEGEILGELVPTGNRPRFGPKLEAAGFRFVANVFTPPSQPRQQKKQGRG